MFIFYATVNGFIVIIDFLISKFSIILLIVLAIVFTRWEVKEQYETEFIDDQRGMV